MKFIILALMAKGALAAPMPFDDAQFGCIDRAKAEKYVDDYNIDTRSFGGMELCDSKVDTKKLFNDLQIIEEGKFNLFGGGNNLIRSIIKADEYYNWMRGETRGIERGNDIPTATAYNSMGYFTMQDGWAALSTLGRVGTVIHEARHTAGYRHYVCRQGSYEGTSMPGCDESYNQKGSHAVEMEYYARVSVQGQNFHPVYQSMARLMAMARANFVFNTPILVKRETIVAANTNEQPFAFVYENGQWIEREVPFIQGVLKRTSAGASIFNGTSAYSIELYGMTGTTPTIRDDYSYFKMLGGRGGNFKEMEEFDLGTRRFLVGVTSSPQGYQVGSFVFGRGEWSSFQNLSFNPLMTTTTLENGEQGFFLVATNGEIYPYDPLSQRLGQKKNFKWSNGVVSVTKFGNKTLMLNDAGEIYENQNGQWVPWGPAQGQTFTGKVDGLVSVPLYDAFEVAK